MTFFRKYTGLIVGGAIALILLLAVLFLMFRFRAGYAHVQDDLESSVQTLERLHTRDPYPSEANVELVERGRNELDGYLHGLLSALSTGQVEEERMERAAFPTLIERTSRRLYALAAERQVILPGAFTFGFQRYAMGNLPQEEYVPRLVVQLRTIDQIIQYLFNAKIAELKSVEREVFDVERVQRDADAESAFGRRGARTDVVAVPTVAVLPEGIEGLYTKEKYRIAFVAGDVAFREVLNTLARCPLFVVVKDVQARNEDALDSSSSAAAKLAARLQRPKDAPSGKGEKKEETTADTRPPRHEDRVVAGLEKVHVTLELDVYRFEGATEDRP